MNKFDTLANSILESLNEADAVTNVATNIVKGITNKPPTFKDTVLQLRPGAKPLGGTNQPPVAPTAPTSTNQPPRNVGGVQPAYDQNISRLSKEKSRNGYC